MNCFWIATCLADIAPDNPKCNQTILASGVSTLFINGKPVVINVLRKFRNSPSWLVISLVVPFNRIPLFSENFITFIIIFFSLFVRVISEPLSVYCLLFILFWTFILYSILNVCMCLSRKSFPEFPVISVPFLATLDKTCLKIGMSRITLTDRIISENFAFEFYISWWNICNFFPIFLNLCISL